VPVVVKSVNPLILLALIFVALNVPAAIVPLAVKLVGVFKLVALIAPVVMVPAVFKLVTPANVVIFGCEAPVTVEAVPVTLPFIGAVTVSPAKVPTPVIFGCEAPVTVVAVVALATVPDMVPALNTPLTFNDPNVPTEVILGCAPVVNVPPSVVPVIAPEAETDVGVIAPRFNVIAGVVVGLATVPETPFAVVTDTVVTPVAGILSFLT
jgi:hypothetical protein